MDKKLKLDFQFTLPSGIKQIKTYSIDDFICNIQANAFFKKCPDTLTASVLMMSPSIPSRSRGINRILKYGQSEITEDSLQENNFICPFKKDQQYHGQLQGDDETMKYLYQLPIFPGDEITVHGNDGSGHLETVVLSKNATELTDSEKLKYCQGVAINETDETNIVLISADTDGIVHTRIYEKVVLGKYIGDYEK